MESGVAVFALSELFSEGLAFRIPACTPISDENTLRGVTKYAKR